MALRLPCRLLFDVSVVTDSELVARCRVGDPDAWREIVERYSRYVYAITQAFRLSSHDAEDVFQDTFTRAYERLHTLRDDDAFRPWLASLTRRLCIDRLRSSAREQPLEDLEAEGEDDRIEELTDAFAVHAALAELPEHCREILDRFFARDESYRTIGDALDLPSGTIASRISRCLTRLRERFTEENDSDPRLEV
jgi:RNA polymerase sigma-70 factor (ECF subfamily)